MTTIQIAYEVPAETVAKIVEHLEDAALRDVNWSGAEFHIERADYTCFPNDDGARAIIMLNEIQRIISGHSA